MRVLLPLVIVLMSSPATAGYELLASFDEINGRVPIGDLVRDAQGNVYGAAYSGGADRENQWGTVFRYGREGSLTAFSEFGPDGWGPFSGLAMGTDGTIYGSTQSGGSGTVGSVYKVSTSGQRTTLHQFNFPNTIDGASPVSTLTFGPGGVLYGTTEGGGFGDNGTVFKITPDGEHTVLHRFSGYDGTFATSPVTFLPDGSLIGSMETGGNYNKGTLFSLSTEGVLTTMHHFSGVDGQYARDGLIVDSDGSYWGATVQGGNFGFGTLFRFRPLSGLEVVHHFNGIEGYSPIGGLAVDPYGTMYGMTNGGGTVGFGVIYSMNQNGQFRVLHDFSGAEGRNPWSRLLYDGTNGFYGTTMNGGDYGHGALFRFSTAIPEPSTWVTMILGFAAVGIFARRKHVFGVT